TIEDILKTWTQCCYFLPKKNRLCNIVRSPGSQFCGNHRPDAVAVPKRVSARAGYSSGAANSSGITRIPCPIDPSHTIYKHDLQSHIKICNVGRREALMREQPYYREACNSRNNVVGTTSDNIDANLLMSK